MKCHISLILPGILLISLLFIPAVFAAENHANGTETSLFTLVGEPLYMTFDGDRVFWLQDSKHLNVTERGFYVYNLTDRSKKQIYRTGPQRDLTGPVPTMSESPGGQSISGDRVVYHEYGIMLTNITTGSTIQLTNQNDSTLPISERKHNYNPWINRDRVVWTEHKGDSLGTTKGKIVLLNLTTGERYYLPTGAPGNQSFPRISGDSVIWMDIRNGGRDNPDLYLFNIKTGTETCLTQPKMLRAIPYIQGDQVLWAEKIDGIFTIIHYDISTGTRNGLGPGSLHEGHIPQLSDNRVVWLQPKNPLDIGEQRSAVTVVDLITGEKNRITQFRDGLSSPVISGDRIIYTRGAGENIFTEPREVVLYTLAPRPVLSVSTIQTRTGPDNTTPSILPNQKATHPSRTTPAASPGFSAMLLIIGLAMGAILGKIQKNR